MANPPSPEKIRLTITVSPEVHAAFSRMAKVSGLPVGRCMGAWLEDTLEGAEFVTGQLEKAREAPRQVVAEMRQWALGAVDQADELLGAMRAGKPLNSVKVLVPGQEGGPRARGVPAAPEAASPRPVIRGGKSSKKAPRGPK